MKNFFTPKEIEEILNKPPYVPGKNDALIGLEDEFNNGISFYYNKSTGVICVKKKLLLIIWINK